MRHEESHLQQACVRWFRYQYPQHAQLLIAVPNGVRTSAMQGRILKAEGMLAGVADLLLLLPRHGYGCLCIEMKTTEKGSVQRETQKQWQQATEQAPNKYVVVRDFIQFKTEIKTYLAD